MSGSLGLSPPSPIQEGLEDGLDDDADCPMKGELEGTIGRITALNQEMLQVLEGMQDGESNNVLTLTLIRGP